MASVFLIDEAINTDDLACELAEHGTVVLNYCHGDQAAAVLAKLRPYFGDPDRPVIHLQPLLSVADQVWIIDVLTTCSPTQIGNVLERALNAWVKAGRPRQYWHAE